MPDEHDQSRLGELPSVAHGDLPRQATGPSAHTPGPWFAVQGDDASEIDIQTSPRREALCYIVATAWGTASGSVPELPANANLLAAAPELFAALKEILDQEEIDGVDGGRIRISFDFRSPLARQARAAIAKAEGRQVTYLKRHRADTLQREIFTALRQIGIFVVDTSQAGHGCPDGFAFCPSRGWTALEIKTGAAGLRPSQEAAGLRAPICIVRSVAEALALFGVRA